MEKNEFYQALEACLKKEAIRRNLEVSIRKERVEPGIDEPYDGIAVFVPKDELEYTADLDFYHGEFENGRHLPDIAKTILDEVFEELGKDATDAFHDALKNTIKLGSLICMLVPREGNEKILASSPNRQILNLSIIACFSEGENIVAIDNTMLKKIGLSSDELLDIAIQNTIKREHCIFATLALPVDVTDERIDIHTVPRMCIMTNHTNRFGATCLLDKSFLKKIADSFGGRCYIIPSSIHEVIAIPCNVTNKDYLTETIRFVNQTGLSPKERLSDTPYILEGDELRIA